MIAQNKEFTELDDIFKLIKWSSIEKHLASLNNNEESTSLVESLPYAPIVMFRALLLQRWYNLNDKQLIQQLERDLMFRRFVGLKLNEAVPNHESLLRFRKESSEKDLFIQLVNRLHLSLIKAGFVIKPGQLNIVDASIVGSQESPSETVRTQHAHQVNTSKTVMNEKERYDKLTKMLHWFFAFSIIYITISGYSLPWINSYSHGLHDFIAHFNVSLATVLTVFFPLRVIWMHFRNELPPVKGTSTQQHHIAKLAHSLIYMSIAAVLITGYLMIPDGYQFFNLFEIPTPFHNGPATHFFFISHRISCALLAFLVVMHVLAVVQHYVFHHVNILRRMA